MESVESVVRRSIAKVLSIPEEDVLIDDNLVEAFDVDSLDQVTIAMELEEVFNISFPDNEFSVIKTVSDVVKVTETCIERKV